VKLEGATLGDAGEMEEEDTLQWVTKANRS
jgi:hypothetical protein